MRVRSISLMLVVAAVFAVGASALPPAGTIRPSQSRATAVLDYDTYINANRILAFITNDGNVFTDTEGLFGRADGFYYPFTSVSDITSGKNNKTVVYDAGLWLGGKVNNQVRIAVAEYSTEFVPGPMHDGTFTPDSPDFRVYKLSSDSVGNNANADYLNWPVDQGAPVDSLGKPALIGNQMTWAVFNDANASAHTNNAGSTAPLGIEVRMTTWATSSASSTEGDAVYVKCLLYNKGGNQIDSFYVSFWADPDLGGSSDDLVGCDTLISSFFCYNGDNSDTKYGIPPAWGGRIISGLLKPSPGSVAEFNGQPLADYRNLPMTAFAKYINGTDPTGATQVFNYMKGRTPDGQPLPNGTTYAVPGDPVAGTGDFDYSPADRRLMASCGPVSFPPGDSQQIVFKFSARIGNDRLSSIADLKTGLTTETPFSSICDSGVVSCYDYGTLTDVRFEPASLVWLRGYPWQRSFFDGGVTTADHFFGSRFLFSETPESLSSVELRFSKTATQKAYRYLFPHYEYAGYYDVPFTAWDVSTGRQINVAFVEDPESRTYDSTWSPDDSLHLGGREYLVIFRSTYSSSPLDEYISANLRTDADLLDGLYGGWFRLADGHDLSELGEGQKLVFESQIVNKAESLTVVNLPTTAVHDTAYQKIQVGCVSTGFGNYVVSLLGASAFSIAPYTDPPSEGIWHRRVTRVRETANGSGPVDPPYGWPVRNSVNSTGEWYIDAPVYPDFELFDYFGLMGPFDFEIRFTGVSDAYNVNNGQTLSTPPPFEVWNIGTADDDDPSDDWRMTVGVTDADGDGKWEWGDRIYALDLPYGWSYQPFYRYASLRVVFRAANGSTALRPATGTIVRFVSDKTVPVPPQEEDDWPSAGAETSPAPAPGAALEPNTLTAAHYRIMFAPQSDGYHTATLYVRDSATNVLLRTVTLAGVATSPCCTNLTGNVDCDLSDGVDIGDLTALIDHLFITFSPLCCETEANADGAGSIDIADLTVLISHLFVTFQPLPACP